MVATIKVYIMRTSKSKFQTLRKDSKHTAWGLLSRQLNALWLCRLWYSFFLFMEQKKQKKDFPSQHKSITLCLEAYCPPKDVLQISAQSARVSPFSRTPGWPTLSRSYSTPWNERRNTWLQHSVLRNAAHFNKWPSSHSYITCEGITSPTKFYWIFFGVCS